MSLEAAAQAMREAMRETVKRHSLWYLVQGALMVLGGVLALTENLLRHRRRPAEPTRKWLGVSGHIDRQLLAWRSVSARGALPRSLIALHLYAICRTSDIEAIHDLWITHVLPEDGVGVGSPIIA